MGLSSNCAATAILALGVTSGALASENGYDPLALDHFVSANLAIERAQLEADPTDPVASDGDLLLALQKLVYDKDGYLLGPNGERIFPLVRIRGQIGVFR